MTTPYRRDYLELRQHRAIESGERFLVVAMEDNLQWLESEIIEFFELTDSGYSFLEIAHKMRRPLHEIKYLSVYLSAPKLTHETQKLSCKARALYRERYLICTDKGVAI